MDTIPGSDLVEGKTTADKIDPAVPDKTKVDDPTKLSDVEKDTVKQAIEEANKDKDGKSTLPEGTEITVGDDGTATIKYPDKSVDTITSKDLVEGKTDAEKINPIIPDDKVKVDDATKLTDKEKEEIVQGIVNANKDEEGKSTLPTGTEIDVTDNGTVTIKYPDGSKTVVSGDKVVEEKTDAEKNQLKVNVEQVSPGGEVMVTDDGTAILTYADGTQNTIAGSDLVVARLAVANIAAEEVALVPTVKVTKA